MSAQLDERFVDDAVYAYVDWREACTAVRDTYTHWSTVPVSERRFAFWVYRAALESEGRASCVYADRVSRIADPVGPQVIRESG
jgi:hypothetical protein